MATQRMSWQHPDYNGGIVTIEVYGEASGTVIRNAAVAIDRALRRLEAAKEEIETALSEITSIRKMNHIRFNPENSEKKDEQKDD